MPPDLFIRYACGPTGIMRFCAVCAAGSVPASGAGVVRAGYARVYIPSRGYYMGEGECGRRWHMFCAAEESPPTGQARSRMQVRVARVTAMTQKRHGPPSVMKRLSPR